MTYEEAKELAHELNEASKTLREEANKAVAPEKSGPLNERGIGERKAPRTENATGIGSFRNLHFSKLEEQK
jgi:hypothetical protein